MPAFRFVPRISEILLDVVPADVGARLEEWERQIEDWVTREHTLRFSRSGTISAATTSPPEPPASWNRNVRYAAIAAGTAASTDSTLEVWVEDEGSASATITLAASDSSQAEAVNVVVPAGKTHWVEVTPGTGLADIVVRLEYA